MLTLKRVRHSLVVNAVAAHLLGMKVLTVPPSQYVVDDDNIWITNVFKLDHQCLHLRQMLRLSMCQLSLSVYLFQTLQWLLESVSFYLLIY